MRNMKVKNKHWIVTHVQLHAPVFDHYIWKSNVHCQREDFRNQYDSMLLIHGFIVH